MEKDLKELLLKDLCARLPYGVKVQVDNKHWCDFNSSIPSKLTFENSYRLLFVGTNLGYVKPYLFPFSSMGPKHYVELVDLGDETSNDCFVSFNFNQLDWLNAHHYDYRRLIEKGLAIDATDKNIY